MLMSLVIIYRTILSSNSGNIDKSNNHLYTRKQESNIFKDLACSWRQFFILTTVIFKKNLLLPHLAPRPCVDVQRLLHSPVSLGPLLTLLTEV